MAHPLSIGAIILCVIFLAVLAGFAWKHRENKFVFYAWIAVIAMIVAAFFYFEVRGI